MDDVLCLKDIKTVANLPLESVVEVSGTVQLRPDGQANKASSYCSCYMFAYML